MKKNILLIASGSFMALHGVSAAAQETPPADTTVETETTTTTPTENGEGAVVTRETTTTTATTDMGEVETEIDSMQTVETPSGNATTVEQTNDAEGKTTTTVDHSKMDHSAHKQDDSEESESEPEAN